MDSSFHSRTAMRVAMHRAVHQIVDHPVIFDDPLAIRLMGLDGNSLLQAHESDPVNQRFAKGLRSSLAGRSRYAEDELRSAIAAGIMQYVVLGAGLDTYALRHSNDGNKLVVFEVDHPATQAWKRILIEQVGLVVPRMVTFVPVDFEEDTLEIGLRRAGFDATKRSFFSWLGVTMYLTTAAIETTLQFVASLPSGTRIVFDYMVQPTSLDPTSRMVHDALAQRVARAGEPFLSYYHPASLIESLRSYGFRQVTDAGPDEINERYFKDRQDGMRYGRLSHIMNAVV